MKMKSCGPLKGIVLLVGTVLLSDVMATLSLGGVIDTRPASVFPFFAESSGPDAGGGTFTADNTKLQSFTLQLRLDSTPSAGTFQAVVLGTDGSGAPVLPILWQSGDLNLPVPSTEFTFYPGVDLSPGDLYFIGADFGSMTTATGGNNALLGLVDNHPDIPVGTYWRIVNGVGAPIVSGPADIASRIVMVPEPHCLVLGVLCPLAVLLAIHRRPSVSERLPVE